MRKRSQYMHLNRWHVPVLFVLLPVTLSTAALLPRSPDPSTIPLNSVQASVIRLPDICGVKLAPLRPNGEIPNDVELGLTQANLSVVQRAANLFSWQEFLSINLPAKAGARGEADTQRSISAACPRVWETWKETHEVYLNDGREPGIWNTPPVMPAEAGPEVMAHPLAHLLSAVLQAAPTDITLPPVLTDRYGHAVRYEVRMNRVLFEFIRGRSLFDSRKQAVQESISFPDGSMLIKASWRELESRDSSRYLTTRAWLYDLKDGKPVHWRRQLMGLVGLHIVQKTPSAPQWIWSTFEHIDNLNGARPSFLISSNGSDVANMPTRAGDPCVVSRMVPVPSSAPDCSMPSVGTDNVHALNEAVRQELSKRRSLLQYYELVNTQWPLPAWQGAPLLSSTVFRTLPHILANTTMETFAQDTSSCMGCHAMARSSRTDHFVSADFTFTLNNAQPVLKNDRVLGPMRKPISQWDRQNWSQIKRGKELTEHTYELLPQFVRAKLHCESCHIDGGRNPDSAWWVGMSTKYPTLEKLQARVNQCFERSMNGSPLPTAANAETLDREAPDMYAFVAYMKWLDEQYQANNSLPAHTGLVIPAVQVGSEERGTEIYLQKCAVCHGKEGKGRYGHNTYFRPALWGVNSFNSLAGLNKADKLAGFLKANMPFGSGGELTDQEAWDVGAFIRSKQRPSGPFNQHR